MFRKIRLTLAVLFLLGITLLFLDFTGTVQPLFGWMAKLQLLPNVMALNLPVLVLLLLLVLMFGRTYCSVICPLGVMQDVFAWIGKWKIFRKNKKAKMANKYSYSKPKTWLRIAVLVVFIVMIVAGFNALAMLIAPYSMYGRMVSSLMQTVYIDANNLFASWAEANDSYAFYEVEQHNSPLILAAISGVMALILFVLAFRNGRTWCNCICPVGTVLGFLNKYAWMKVRVDEDKCIKCGLCEKNCKAACISVKKGEPLHIDYTRCVDCGDCELACTKGAIRIKAGSLLPAGTPSAAPSADASAIAPSADASATAPSADASATLSEAPVPDVSTSGPTDTSAPTSSTDASISRRSFLSIIGMATVASAIEAQEKTTDGGFAAIEDKQIPARKTPLTPAGSLSARNLQQRCTACQLCISNCPNGVLRPNTSLDHFLQPVMEYENGYCRPECTRCADVCPAGAIRPITVEQKSSIQIGHAVWVKKNCLPVTDGVTCGNCARHCPSGAIQMVPIDKSLKMNEDGHWTDADGNRVNEREMLCIPAINTEKCIGCGACENLCPSRPFSAIYVEGHEIHREI